MTCVPTSIVHFTASAWTSKHLLKICCYNIRYTYRIYTSSGACSWWNYEFYSCRFMFICPYDCTDNVMNTVNIVPASHKKLVYLLKRFRRKNRETGYARVLDIFLVPIFFLSKKVNIYRKHTERTVHIYIKTCSALDRFTIIW